MSPASAKVVYALWTWPSLLLLMILAVAPVAGQVMPQFDGLIFPVTGKVEFVDVRPVEGGIVVRMSYEKVRDCEYLGATLDLEGVPVSFAPLEGGQPMTLATGRRLSREWMVGAASVEGLRLRWVHRCNPFWTTITVGYP